MATIQQVKEKLNKYDGNQLYVFKKCSNSIVTLKKLEDTITNEKRRNVVNKKYAKFRGNKFYVENIFNIVTLEEEKSVKSVYKNSQLTYVMGEIIEEKDYDTDIHKICSAGIHYFLTIEPAYYLELDRRTFNGDHFVWFDNGQLYQYSQYIDGKVNGTVRQWSEYGQLMFDAVFINDICV
uniref:Uncharacterized protein n=1 Tax=viral metagenome TaxID=1070528 RepID=A0A6C0ECJ5_9ZZZZ